LEDEMAEQRNPVEMTEEEIAEAAGDLPPQRRAMSVTGEVEPLGASTDEVPSAAPEEPPPAP
jgi:hypothetical protein